MASPKGDSGTSTPTTAKPSVRKGPAPCRARSRFEPDTTTQAVLDLVNQRFADHPGRLDSFAWPVTRAQGLEALQTFIAERLPLFGRYEDALWPGEPWLYHSQLSAALNLKLIHPREVVEAAETAYRQGLAPLASVEGFIRQILGWREFVRGIYWTQMPGYLERNALDAQQDLPGWYWTGDTDMACLRDAITQTLEHGYAHHIQRLMVTGLFALLLGVAPRQVHAWYLGRLCRCRGVGGAAQHAGHEPVRRRRPDGQQTLRRHRQVHPAHGRSLCKLAATTRPSAKATGPVRTPRCTGTF